MRVAVVVVVVAVAAVLLVLHHLLLRRPLPRIAGSVELPAAVAVIVTLLAILLPTHAGAAAPVPRDLRCRHCQATPRPAPRNDDPGATPTPIPVVPSQGVLPPSPEPTPPMAFGDTTPSAAPVPIPFSRVFPRIPDPSLQPGGAPTAGPTAVPPAGQPAAAGGSAPDIGGPAALAVVFLVAVGASATALLLRLR